MMRVVSTPYIEWAKQKKGQWNLSVSGLPHATLDDLGGVPADMPLAGDNAYGLAPLSNALPRIIPCRHRRLSRRRVVRWPTSWHLPRSSNLATKS